MSTAPNPPQLLPTAALVSLLVVLLGATGLFALSYTHEKSVTALERLGWLHAAQVDAVKAQVNFKTQVQEWKDLLLRGSNPTDFATHWGQFGEREADVREGLTSLQNELAWLGLDAEPAKRLADAHAALGVEYRKALAAYRREDRDSAFAVDGSVRGIDRQLNRDIDALSKTVHAAAQEELTTFRRHGEESYAILRKITLGLAGLTVLVAFWLVFQTARAASRPSA